LARKAEWRALGAVGGHSEQVNSSQPETDSFEDTSAFDPVLAEFIYRWFTPKGGRVFDPFAGEAIKGIVATKLGFEYVGLELREDQVEKNRKLAKEIGVSPTWIRGDSEKMNEYVSVADRFDLVFTSPPYYDTEIYSTDKQRDGSAFGTYEEFMVWYESIFRQAVDRLKPNRFLVIKVGEGTRNKQGFFNNLVGDTISCFLRLGLRYYNTAVLATSLGTAPQRVKNQFPNYRKLVGTHQNVLFFFKGDDPSVIPAELGLIDENEGTLKPGA
jgi:DNA modification methylase